MYSIQKKFLCLILCLAMVFTALPIGVFAEDKNSEVETSAIEQIAEEVEEEKQEEEAPEISAEDSEEEKEVTEEVTEEIEEAEEEETPIETVDEEEKETPTEEVEEDEKETPTEEETEEVETPAEEEEVEEETPAEDETEEELPKEDEEEKEQPEETEDEKVEEETPSEVTEEIIEQAEEIIKIDTTEIEKVGISLTKDIKLIFDKNGAQGSAPNAKTYAVSKIGGFKIIDNLSSFGSGSMTKEDCYFGGWSKNSGDNNTPNNSITIYENTNVYAVWYPNDVPVTYKAYQGDNSAKVSINYTKTITFLGCEKDPISLENKRSVEISSPSKTGYTFDGWTYEDCTFTAHWTAKEYTVKLYNTLGTKLIDTISVTYGTKYQSDVIIPEDYDNYIFAGYYKYLSNDQYFDGNGKATCNWDIDSNSEIKLYAHFEIGYKITLDANGGAFVVGDSTSIKVFNGKKFGLLADLDNIKPYKTGYEFLGWYRKDGTTKVTSDTKVDASSFTDDASKTLYAHWKAKTYDVYLVKIDEESTNKIIATYDSTLGAVTVPEREGYNFLGYYDKLVGGTQYIDKDGKGSKVWNKDPLITDKVLLYAHWDAIEYTVELNPNSGSIEGKTESKTSKVTVLTQYTTLLAQAFTMFKTGYSFDGWFTDAINGEKVTAISSFKVSDFVDGVRTLYAHWKPIEYSVLLFDNDTKLDTVKVKYDSVIDSITIPELAGYDFLGYFDSLKDNATQYIDKDGNGTIAWDKTPADLCFNLYAKWEARTDTPYTVKHLTQKLIDLEDGTELTLTTVLNLISQGIFEVAEEETDLQGTTAKNTEAQAKNLDGFTHKKTLQVPILGSGKSIAYVFYTRDRKDVTYTEKNILELFGKSTTEKFYYGSEIKLALTENAEDYPTYKVGVNSFEGKENFTIPNPEKEGYKFGGWIKNSILNNVATYTLYPNWLTLSAITVSGEAIAADEGQFEGGRVKVNKFEDVAAGEAVTVDVVKTIGYVLTDLYYTTAAGVKVAEIKRGITGEYKFIMPDEDIIIVAEFEEPEEVDYTLYLAPNGKAIKVNDSIYEEGLDALEELDQSDSIKYIHTPRFIGGKLYPGYWQLSGAAFKTNKSVAVLFTNNALVELVGENNIIAGSCLSSKLKELEDSLNELSFLKDLDLKLNLEGFNNDYSIGIYSCEHCLAFAGSGSLNVSAANADVMSHAINVGHLEIYGAKIYAQAGANKNTTFSYGVFTTLGIKEYGVLGAKGYTKAMYCEIKDAIYFPKHTGVKASKDIDGDLERGYFTFGEQFVTVATSGHIKFIPAEQVLIYPKEEVTISGIEFASKYYNEEQPTTYSGFKNSMDTWVYNAASSELPVEIPNSDIRIIYFTAVPDPASKGAFIWEPTNTTNSGATVKFSAPMKVGTYKAIVFVSDFNLDFYGKTEGTFSILSVPRQKKEITVPVSGSDDTVKISIDQKGDTATLKDIQQKDLEEVGTDDIVVVDLSQLLNPVHELQISDLTIQNIIDSEAKGLEIRLKEAIITFDHDALETIKSQMGGLGMTLTVNTEVPAEKTLSDSQKETLKEKPKALVIDAFIVSHGVRIKNFNGNAKVSIKVPDEMVGQTIKVYYLDEQGVLENMAATFTYVDKDQYATFVTTHFSHYILEGDGLPFVDVLAPDYFYDPVVWAFQNGIVKGDDETHFLPNGFTTRAQMVTFLWRVAGCPEVEYDMPFTDVPEDEYYAPAVRWGVAMGYVKGTEETLFSPEEAVTRGQTVTFLARYSGINDDSTEYNHAFIDVPATEYYNTAVAWAATNNITLGTTELQFEPESKCLRSEIVTFLWRLFAKKEEK